MLYRSSILTSGSRVTTFARLAFVVILASSSSSSPTSHDGSGVGIIQPVAAADRRGINRRASKTRPTNKYINVAVASDGSTVGSFGGEEDVVELGGEKFGVVDIPIADDVPNLTDDLSYWTAPSGAAEFARKASWHNCGRGPMCLLQNICFPIKQSGKIPPKIEDENKDDSSSDIDPDVDAFNRARPLEVLYYSSPKQVFTTLDKYDLQNLQLEPFWYSVLIY